MPRVLSEEEFNAIKQAVLAKAPPNLDETGFTRYIGPAMSQAIGTAENLPATPQGSALGRFVGGAWENLNPMGLVHAVAHPIDTAANLVSGQADQFRKAASDYQQGHYAEMVGHGAAGLVPLVGPAAARAGESIGQGDIAGGLGQSAGLLAPFGVDAAITKGPAAVRAVLPTETATRLGNRLEAGAADRLATTMGPKVGPNKVRLTNQLADKAPDLLREPGLSAVTKEGYAGKVSAKLDDAIAAMDEAADTRLASQQVQTPPILKALDAEMERLIAHPADASAYPRRVSPTQESSPLGGAVEPAPNSAQLATLRQIRNEVAQLGPVAPYESIRRIRQAWDQVAKVKYLPATAQDALKAQGDATAAMKGTGALREGLAGADPESAAAYRSYSLFKAADDVLAASQEAERARPQVGRGLMRTTGGAVAGSVSGGAPGAVVGATIGYIVDRAASYAPTLQIVIARRMQAIADALRSGDVSLAESRATTLKAKLPPEFAPTDAVVASPRPSGARGPTDVQRTEQMMTRIRGRQQP